MKYGPAGDRRRLRVLVSGYYGFQNAGDEAILYALIRGLESCRPGIDITVLSADPEHTAGAYGVRAVSRTDPRTVLGALRACDLFISGGGGLIQDVTSLASLQYYLGLIALARLLGRPVFIYAQGIGPLETRTGRFLTRAVLNRVQAVTVRDVQSRDLLWALGVRRPPVEVTADPVLGLEPESGWRARGRELLAAAGVRDGRVAGFSVRPWSGAGDYAGALARVADELNAAGYRTVFLPFHHPGDLAACRVVAARMEAPAVIVEERLDFAALLGLCTHLDLAVGMRLHFLVFAALAGVVPVGLPYDPKVRLFLDRLELPAAVRVDQAAPEDLSRAVAAALAQREALEKTIRTRVETLRREARRTPALACDLLPRAGKQDRDVEESGGRP
ncbi:polysaccharide pyruvyl transferase CsaB [Candidatus Desulforudis audaxviator]|uniref:Polysaccharide pyruvyl transferase n=1 Tax=Desulforudis audaxviator (strain MP104C) TaxID=477974 RepID=B1I6B8_DESAP|nr:polysaccharide pyruvyl transferase CsaB [Candidatus Desulforudis audaxviator]ACA60585.1 polysaccharide pyruvyl transferase [Candidatus Desulforudis audaxviator MP104C]AZK60660.1 Poly(glycerol-phosphate) alpha-glucosyltransferase [Candidatus Desulforudis audaxviator]